MPNHYCCVLTCKMTKRNAGTDVRFIKFPVDPKLLEKWRAVIGRGPEFPISQSTRICSRHFVSGRRSLNPSSEDYIPSIFPPSEYRKRSLCRGCRKMNCICESDGFNPAQISGMGLASNSSENSNDAILPNLPSDEDNDGLNEKDGTPLNKRRKLTPVRPSTSTSKTQFSQPAKSESVFVTTKFDVMARIKEAEEEHSRKMELMCKHQNMTIANLKEEFQQKIHTMKCEWEEEKQKLWGEIGYLKEVLTRRPYF